jgi:hypothetical protein
VLLAAVLPRLCGPNRHGLSACAHELALATQSDLRVPGPGLCTQTATAEEAPQPAGGVIGRKRLAGAI